MIYKISYKTLIRSKLSRIRFNKIDEFIRIYDGTGYLILLGSEKYPAMYNRIRYIISLKSSITYTFSHYFAKMKVDYYDFLAEEKILTLRSIIIIIKSVLNKDKITTTISYF